MVIGGADLDPDSLRPAALRAHGEDLPRARRVRARADAGGARARHAVPRDLPRDAAAQRGAAAARSTSTWSATTARNSHRRVIGTFAGTEHDIDLEPGSLAERALGEPVHEARCHHHQALDRLGDGPHRHRARARRGARGDRAQRRRRLGARRPVAPRGGRQARAVPRVAEACRDWARRLRARLDERPDHLAPLVLLRVPQHPERVRLAGQLDRLDRVVVVRPADRRPAPRPARPRPGGGGT